MQLLTQSLNVTRHLLRGNGSLVLGASQGDAVTEQLELGNVVEILQKKWQFCACRDIRDAHDVGTKNLVQVPDRFALQCLIYHYFKYNIQNVKCQNLG